MELAEQKSRRLRRVNDMKACIGIDLGGTFIKYGLVSEVGEIIEKGKISTPAGCGYTETVEAIATATNGLANQNGVPICGLGIGAPGVVDGERGTVRSSGNLGWENKPLAKDLSERLGIPVTLANDANAAAYGEYACGAGKQYNSIVLLTLGTGVGSGIVLNGKLYEGNEGAGAELGHEVIRMGGEKCACGRRGCFEAYASATALIRQTKRVMEKDKQSMLWQLCGGDINKVNGKTAFDGAQSGDRTAKRVVSNYLRYLSEGLANIANTFRPEAILIGGGISAQGESLVKPLQKRVDKLMLGHGAYAPVKIKAASLGNDAGLVGAAMLAKERERR